MAQQGMRTDAVSGLLPPDVTSEIFADMLEQSAAQQAARQVDVPGSGLSIPVITGEPNAGFVKETEEKPVSKSSLGQKNLTPHTLAVIEPFSNQFRRDLPGLYRELRRRLPFALGKAFDEAVFFGTDAPTGGWDDLSSVSQTLDLTSGTVYDDIVDAMAAIGQAGGNLDGLVVSPAGQAALMKAKANGEPLFVPSPINSRGVGQVLGRPVYVTRAVHNDPQDSGATANTEGFLGDWSSAVWGAVDGINISVSSQATITDGQGNTINLWQRNMFAVRAEVEIGFTHQTDSKFYELTGQTTTP